MDDDKMRFDVMAHLNDIPMLGKQYVPELWRQMESGSAQYPTSTMSMPIPVSQSHVIPTTSVQQPGKENTRAQAGGFYRMVDKRSLPTPSDVVADSSLSAPLPKMARFEKR